MKKKAKLVNRYTKIMASIPVKMIYLFDYSNDSVTQVRVGKFYSKPTNSCIE